MNMISTGAFQTEMDASTKTETLAEKFVRVWEKKNSKVARAGGVSLMALSLAACGSDDAQEVVEEETPSDEPVVLPTGKDQSFTALEDRFSGTEGADDTFTGSSATLTAADDLVDTDATDNDTLNVTFTTTAPTMDVAGIENVNITWDSLLVPAVDLDDVSGATVTVTTARTGHNGNISLTNVDANNVVVGSGFNGTVDVDGLDGASVTADSATTLRVGNTTAADGTISVSSTSATTVDVASGDDVTVSAPAATTVTIDGADAEVVGLTVGVDADLTLTTAAAGVSTITSSATDAITLSLQAGFVSSATTIVGDINLSTVVANVDGETITNAGTVTLTDALTDGLDLSSVASSGFVAEDVALGGNADVTMASGQSITLETGTFGGELELQTTADADSAADVINVTLEVTTSDELDVANGDGDFETLNLTVAPAAGTTAITIDDIDAGTGTVNMISADADVDITITAGGTDGIAAGTFDASGVAGELTATQNATAAAMSMVGAADATTMTFTGTTHETTFESTNAADDSVTLATTSGGATVVFAGGDNTTLANSIDSGSLAVTAGSGDDVVELNGLTTGNAVLSLGDGDNTVRLGDTGNLAGATVSVTTGVGDNNLVFEDSTVAATDITIDFGTGTGTITLEANIDITGGTLNVTGLDVIALGAASGTATVEAGLLNGQTYLITGDSATADQLVVEFDNTAAGSFDFSGLVLSNDIALGHGGLNMTGSALNDTVIGTDSADNFDGSANADYTLTMGEGADTVTMGTGDVTINVASGDSGTTVATADTLTGFTSGTDTLSTGTAGSLANYSEVDLASGAASTMANAITGADAVMDGTIWLVLVEDTTASGAGADALDMTTDSVLCLDWDLDGSTDATIILESVLSGGFAGTDIIA